MQNDFKITVFEMKPAVVDVDDVEEHAHLLHRKVVVRLPNVHLRAVHLPNVHLSNVHLPNVHRHARGHVCAPAVVDVDDAVLAPHVE